MINELQRNEMAVHVLNERDPPTYFDPPSRLCVLSSAAITRVRAIHTSADILTTLFANIPENCVDYISYHVNLS